MIINRKGMTLIEVLIVIVIIGIIIGPVFGTIHSSSQILAKTEQSANAKMIANNIFQYIENKVKYANVILIDDIRIPKLESTLGDATTNKDALTLIVEGEELKYYQPAVGSAEVIFNKKYMERMTLETKYRKVDVNTISVEVVMKKEGEKIHVLGPNKIKLENINTAIRTGDRIDGTEGNIINYIMP